MADNRGMDNNTSATHIRLVCWCEQHVQAISAEALRQLITAPICTARVGDDICGNPIWAVEHDGEPTRYVGRPPVPEGSWRTWADCIEGNP